VKGRVEIRVGKGRKGSGREVTIWKGKGRRKGGKGKGNEGLAARE